MTVTRPSKTRIGMEFYLNYFRIHGVAKVTKLRDLFVQYGLEGSPTWPICALYRSGRIRRIAKGTYELVNC